MLPEGSDGCGVGIWLTEELFRAMDYGWGIQGTLMDRSSKQLINFPSTFGIGNGY